MAPCRDTSKNLVQVSLGPAAMGIVPVVPVHNQNAHGRGESGDVRGAKLTQNAARVGAQQQKAH